MYSGVELLSSFGTVGLSADGRLSNAEWKDSSEIAVMGSAVDSRLARGRGRLNVETTVSDFCAVSSAKGFKTSFATFTTTSNLEASSRVGSR